MSPAGQAPWQLYEEQIKNLLAGLNDGKVTHNITKDGHLSTRPRQIDVFVEGTIVGRPISVVVECKRYKTKRIGIDIVESFIGKLLDLGISRGIMYAYAGFTKDAWLRAHKARNPEVSLEEYSGPDVGLVPLGVPEPSPRRRRESSRQMSGLGGQVYVTNVKRPSPYSQSDSQEWYPDSALSYTGEEYERFLLTGSFSRNRLELPK